MEKNKLTEEVRKAYNIIERVDGVVINNLAKCQHASEDFKKNQRILNALLNVMRTMDVLQCELNTP